MHQIIPRLQSMLSDIQTKLTAQFHRMMDIESVELKTIKREKKDGNEAIFYTPELKRGQVVKVDFVGLGTVIDKSHWAVVWYAFPADEHIVVLPLTSKVRSSEFDLGTIPGLPPGNSLIKANQPQSVSRKSVAVSTRKENNKYVPIHLTASQLTLAEDLFRKTQIKDPTLYNVLMYNIGINIPEINSDVISALKRPVVYAVEGDKLFYKVSDSVRMKSVLLQNVNTTLSNRNKLMKNLLIGTPTEKQSAEVEIGKLLAQSKVSSKQVAASEEENN